MGDEYEVRSPPNGSLVHTVSPVRLSNAATSVLGPPGVTITCGTVDQQALADRPRDVLGAKTFQHVHGPPFAAVRRVQTCQPPVRSSSDTSGSENTRNIARAPGNEPCQADPFLARHSSLPLKSNANTTRSASTSPVTYSRLSTTMGDDQPLPSPSNFHTSGGPFSGQVGSKPVSLEMPSRRGPRHCGQPGSGEAIKPSAMAPVPTRIWVASAARAAWPHTAATPAKTPARRQVKLLGEPRKARLLRRSRASAVEELRAAFLSAGATRHPISTARRIACRLAAGTVSGSNVQPGATISGRSPTWRMASAT